MKQQGFVHLRVHSEYSLIDGLLRVKPLMKALPTRGMNAIALTDHCNLFAAVKLFKAAVAEGIKPIIGAEIACYHPDKPGEYFSLVLLSQNAQGYKNLTCLVSRAYQEGQIQGMPYVQYDWIAEYSEGLIVLSGGREGDIGRALIAEDFDLAKRRAEHWMRLFPDCFYLEIQRTERENESYYNEKLITLAKSLNCPIVATNDVRFLDKEDFSAHEARVCIHDGYTLADPRRPKKYSVQQYLKSAEEMRVLFSDIPSAVENTVEIAKRCTVELKLGDNFLPDFPVPEGDTIDTYLSELSKQGLEERLLKLYPDKSDEEMITIRKPYDERLEVELKVINNMGFPGYFLIVADFIQWAKNHGVPVGPGRGSGAGSLVAYALKITDLDPLEFDLLFERFLNPERVSMPDFDIDFCMEGRDRVIEYVAEKYGRQAVSQIITFGSMAAKAVVRDVGRVFGHPYGFVDQLAKLIPFEIGMTLTKALEQEEALKARYDSEEEVKELFDLALKLEGITRNAGKHAGGVVIAPSQLTDFTAIYCEEGSSQIVSQFDKDDVEAVGLVKFDFLGLRTLTIIDWALEIVNQQKKEKNEALVDISEIPIDDKKSFDLLKTCQTTAVFQLESRGMKELIGRLQPDCFEEIIALVALFRPGPLQSGMVDDFIDRKHGRAQVVYPHPDLEPILKPTYGVILYQEQVMQIAQVLANYTLGAADMLRRAMGKKKPEEMAKQREIFTKGALERGVEEETATYIFDLMEKFAGYGFNKSHSAAYALVAYQTAWLKAHYPAAFMAAVMSSDMDNTDKVVNFVNECHRMRLKVLPPNVNHSAYKFTVNQDQEIFYGLGAIKGVGEAVINSIVAAQQKDGPFEDLYDFARRLDLKKINRRVFEALIKSGACDDWGIERSVLVASIERVLKIVEKENLNQASGQFDLLSAMDDGKDEKEYSPARPWSDKQRLDFEKETLGFYLTGHPVDQIYQEFQSFITKIGALDPYQMKKAYICGEVNSLRKILTKRGKRLVIIGLDDGSAKIDVVVFSEIFDAYPDELKSGDIIIIEGNIAVDDYNGGVKMTANELLSPEAVRSKFGRCLQLIFSDAHHQLLTPLQSVLESNRGKCPVNIMYKNAHACAELNLDSEWFVEPNEKLVSILKDLLGEKNVLMKY
jgi:DNA polymerase-3 subunit alpha